jgi:uncharacterized lipoprotein YddW (UPF0748 family)
MTKLSLLLYNAEVAAARLVALTKSSCLVSSHRKLRDRGPCVGLAGRLIACQAVVCLTLLLLLALAPAVAVEAEAQVNGQYRAFWVDTYNTRLNNGADVTTIVERARGAGANAVFVQVRRRGDAWYLRGSEPRPEGVSMDAGFDPLAEVLAQAHAAGLEVHAFVVVGAIWNQTTLPTNAQHVFNAHGFTPAGPRTGADNWLTRTRLPDGAATSNGGYRFGSDYWLDFGHPDAASYTVNLLLDLVRNYPIDGLHLDRLQYPEIAGSNDGGASVGYNEVSLQRFREKYGRPADSDPAADDPDWSKWRRDQITALMRRIYLNVVAIKPHVKVSVGAIATGNAPTSDAGWPATDAYARVYQDWRQWTEEGALDFAIPLIFRAEHTPAEAEAFAAWTAWARSHQYQRQAVIGIGSYLNSIEGTIKQIRSVFEPGANPLDGVVLYSVGAHNAPVTRNPLAVPAGRDTPLRTFDDLSSGLRTGRTVAGQAVEAGSANANASSLSGVFATPLALPFSTSVTFPFGHVIGTVQDEDGRPLDSVDVVFESDVAASRLITTDGDGFFGGANLLSAQWRVSVYPAGASGRYLANCTLTISMGQVGRFDLQVDTSRPGVATCLTPQASRTSGLR